jgi:hypothetical protein
MQSQTTINDTTPTKLSRPVGPLLAIAAALVIAVTAAGLAVAVATRSASPTTDLAVTTAAISRHARTPDQIDFRPSDLAATTAASSRPALTDDQTDFHPSDLTARGLPRLVATR